MFNTFVNSYALPRDPENGYVDPDRSRIFPRRKTFPSTNVAADASSSSKRSVGADPEIVNPMPSVPMIWKDSIKLEYNVLDGPSDVGAISTELESISVPPLPEEAPSLVPEPEITSIINLLGICLSPEDYSAY
jgi:hypothetical protein